MPQLQADRVWFPLAALLVLGIAASNTILLRLMSEPVDLIIAQQYTDLLPVLVWLAIWVVINQVFHFSGSLLTARLGLRFVGRVRQQLVSHLLYIGWPAAGQFSQGDIMARLTNDVDEAQRLLVETPFYFFSHLCIIGFYLAMLLWLDLQLALIALALAPLFMLHQKLFVRPRQRVSAGFMQRNGLLLEFEQTLVRYIRNIITLRSGQSLAQRHQRIFQSALQWAMKDRWLESLFNASLMMLIYLVGLFILYQGIADVQAGVLTVGELISFLLFLGYLSFPLRELVQLGFQAQVGIVAIERCTEVLNSEPRVYPPQQPKPWQSDEAGVRIEAEQLSFAYPGQHKLFQQVSFDIAAGETIALVGPSGVGKSSFTQLLLRFMLPDSGQLRLNGVDIRDMEPASLRSHIAVLWQQPVVLPGSLAENLRLAQPDASDAALQTVCNAVGLGNWLAQQQGLETRVGAGGVELSGGQAQRLALAQVLLQDAALWILDEPTSAMDSQSEKEVVELLKKHSQGRTILMVGHRFSALRHLDRVMFFDGNSIVLDTHEQLMNSQPAYVEAIRWQSRTNDC